MGPTQPDPSDSGAAARVLSRALAALDTSGCALCFHSLTAPGLPSASVVNIPQAEFIAALDALEERGRIVPLEELVARHLSGRSTRGLAAITFDDAYVALLALALPELVARGIPAAVFVTTAASRVGATFWWDRVDDLADRLGVAAWDSLARELGVGDAYREGQPAAMGPLRPFRQWMLAEHRGRWPASLEPVLAAAEAAAGVQTAHRAMTFPELAQLAATGLVRVGIHTETHPVLPLLPDGELRREIEVCRDELVQRGLSPLRILAAPFGLFDERTLRLARESGMDATLTLENRCLDGLDQLGRVPRISMTRGIPPWKLRLRLSSTLGRVRRALRHDAAASYPALPSPTT